MRHASCICCVVRSPIERNAAGTELRSTTEDSQKINFEVSAQPSAQTRTIARVCEALKRQAWRVSKLSEDEEDASEGEQPPVFFLLALPSCRDGRVAASEGEQKEHLESLRRAVTAACAGDSESPPPLSFEVLPFAVTPSLGGGKDESDAPSSTPAADTLERKNTTEPPSTAPQRVETTAARLSPSEYGAREEAATCAAAHACPAPKGNQKAEKREKIGKKVAQAAALCAVRRKLPRLREDCVALLQKTENLLQRHEEACGELLEVHFKHTLRWLGVGLWLALVIPGLLGIFLHRLLLHYEDVWQAKHRTQAVSHTAELSVDPEVSVTSKSPATPENTLQEILLSALGGALRLFDAANEATTSVATVLVFFALLYASMSAADLIRRIRHGRVERAVKEQQTLPPPLWLSLKDQATYLSEALWSCERMQQHAARAQRN
ncbi:hypothetical protein BESB_059610 [Besnoitia besnoiti]|uniref:Transmembrane protein n=1 Tax=Besnoitia besnoiti TaxID=94643 RepID=A0A2A9MCY3_BESBE|nr:hypothetical protein BESB_059610 [Besnoitia besnoiti]PFH35074.1 hypothetical protein BESB_059610 [Besnoitia besnoiti]